jgi:hypothetical protein
MRTIQSRVKPLNGRSYGTNTRLISQEELLGILEQDATVLTKGAWVHTAYLIAWRLSWSATHHVAVTT